MARRRSIRHPNSGTVSGLSVGSHPPPDRINPGGARKQRVLDPLRQIHTTQGAFRPSNRWRNRSSGGHSQQTDVRNRPLLLAKQLPWLPQFNFARS